MVLNMAEYWDSRSAVLHKIHDFIGIPRFNVPAVPSRANENPLSKLPPADETSMAKLQEFFRPYNEKLYQVIGAEFDW
jgi:hypothetical protein